MNVVNLVFAIFFIPAGLFLIIKNRKATKYLVGTGDTPTFTKNRILIFLLSNRADTFVLGAAFLGIGLFIVLDEAYFFSTGYYLLK